MKFDIERKGYKKEHVDAYIKQLTMQYENAAAEQRDRIFQLKASLTTAERLIEEYRRKESEINSALVAAVDKAREMEDVAQRKYDLEIQRLKLFNAKWQSYFNELIKRYPIDDNLVSVAEFTGEMADILSGGSRAKANKTDEIYAAEEKEAGKPKTVKKMAEEILAPLTRPSAAKAQFESEKKRLAEVQPDPVSSINKYFENQSKDGEAKTKGAAAPAKPESGFDINEALHPDRELEEILRELGITGGK